MEQGDARGASAELKKNDALFDEVQPFAGAELEQDRAQNKQFFGLTTAPCRERS